MIWFRIDKSGATQPPGRYSDWKEKLREEGKRQCVYCAIHEASYGGFRNFHVEHYRPKKHFPLMENDYFNLFYACGICNSFKGSDWPEEPRGDFSNASYVDPSKVNLGEVFEVEDDATVKPRNPAAAYIIERLFLNRPQLVLLRRMASVREQLRGLVGEMRTLLGDSAPRDAALLLMEVIELLDKLQFISPYEPQDVKR